MNSYETMIVSIPMTRPATLAIIAFGACLAAEPKKAKPEPRVFTAYPMSGQVGAALETTIRGVSLNGAHSLWFESVDLEGRVITVESEPVEAGATKPATPVDLVRAEIRSRPGTKPGSYPVRLVTAAGVTNPFDIVLGPEPVRIETNDLRIDAFPAAINGRIAQKGEVDRYRFRVEAGEEMTLEVTSGHAAFDPSIAILEPSGSWFDSARLNRIAFNDEPLYFPGLSKNAILTFRFKHAGEYLAQVESFGGQGGPDYVYRLRASRGAAPAPSLRPDGKGWDERSFVRALREWPRTLSSRGNGSAEEKPIAVAEGTIAKPAQVDETTFRIEKPAELALEVETPKASMPLFNPVVRILDSQGREVVTNVYTKRNNCGFYMMKMIQAKTTFSIRAEGEYRMEVRDITTDRADAGFAYRVILRPQIPHVGKVSLAEDRLNLARGAAKPLNVTIDREEEFAGLLAVTVEDLPPGVSVLPASEREVEAPPVMNGGRLERYIPKTQKTVLLVSAADGAPAMRTPQWAKVIVRPIRDGKIGDVVVTERVPVMVIEGEGR
ncbi:MAG: hypothetical protein U0Q16_34290 [Bryobacteraceae bacterium]